MGSLRRVVLIVVVVALGVAFSGCDLLPSEDGKLKIGVLPILDVLPLYVGEQEGLFKNAGIVVELAPFGSALERDAAFQAGQIDGEVNDLISAALLNKVDDRARVVRVAMRATPDKSMFVLLASGKNQIVKPTDLKGQEIGLSKNTIIEYVVDRMLAAEGLAETDYRKTDIPKIPVRLELLSNGQLAAACLPEPLASLGVVQGGRIVVDDRNHVEFSQSTVTFSTTALAKKPMTVKRFLEAYEKAVHALNSEPEKYRGLLIDKGRVPAPVKDSFTMPVFPTASVPTETEVKDVLAWMKDKGLLDQIPIYDRLVSATYLPK